MKMIGFFRCIFHTVMLFFRTIKFSFCTGIRFIVQKIANTLGKLQEHSFLVFLFLFIAGYVGTIFVFTDGKGNLALNCIYNIIHGNAFTKDGLIILGVVALFSLLVRAIIFRFLDWLYHLSADLICKNDTYRERMMDTKIKLNNSKQQMEHGSKRAAREYEMEQFKRSSNYYLNQEKGIVRQ